MQEEYGPIGEIIRKNYEYLTGDKRRLVKLGIYMVYLYLFGKRFLLLMSYFKRLVRKYILARFTILASRSNTKLDPINLNTGNMTKKEIFRLILWKFVKFIKFIYSFFLSL